jgi:general stress protein 26
MWRAKIGNHGKENKEEERHRLWRDELKTYFSGTDDPNYCIGIVKPYRIEYYTMTEMAPQVWEAD